MGTKTTDAQKSFEYFAEQLRSVYCDETGKEIDPKESSILFHKMGMSLMDILNSSNCQQRKITAIHAVTLLNAAVLRNPNNIELRQHLEDCCQKILQLASTKHNKSLIYIAEQRKEEILKMRQEISKKARYIEKIPDEKKHPFSKKDKIELQNLEKNKITQVVNMQTEIAKKYIETINHLFKDCVDIMGEAPCDFALVGMGSLSRTEITPYSDFECCIVLDVADMNSVQKLYFERLSFIFNVAVTNLGETKIHSIGIPKLNCPLNTEEDWFYDVKTKNGVSLDECFNPNQPRVPEVISTTPTSPSTKEMSLIDSVQEMVKQIDFKTNRSLTEMLCKTVFVSGNKEVHEKFQEAVQKKLQEELDSESARNQIMEHIRDDLSTFNISKDLNHLHFLQKLDLKRVIYRNITRFVGMLGILHKIAANSSFEILSILKENGVIDGDMEHRLKYAAAVACEIRVKIYIKSDGQDDEITHSPLSNDDTTEIVEAVGAQSVIDFFEITHRLHEILFQYCSNKNNENQNLMNCYKQTCQTSLEILQMHVCFLLNLREHGLSQCKHLLSQAKNVKINKSNNGWLGSITNCTNEGRETSCSTNDSKRILRGNDDDQTYILLEPKALSFLGLHCFSKVKNSEELNKALKYFWESLTNQVKSPINKTVEYLHELLMKITMCLTVTNSLLKSAMLKFNIYIQPGKDAENMKNAAQAIENIERFKSILLSIKQVTELEKNSSANGKNFDGNNCLNNIKERVNLSGSKIFSNYPIDKHHRTKVVTDIETQTYSQKEVKNKGTQTESQSRCCSYEFPSSNTSFTWEMSTTSKIKKLECSVSFVSDSD